MDRHFTTATFVVHNDRVLLHFHKKLQKWLPVGGHVDPNESLCEGALREIREESGLEATLLSPTSTVGMPSAPGVKYLTTPWYVQTEEIEPGHEHLDAIFYAVADTDALVLEHPETDMRWIGEDELATLPLLPDVAWYALDAIRQARARS